ncbi:MAG: alpha/beta fold hydrolase [Lachnospiraceae bacterium]|nr:alpha/beta fold hydrolase [Lachnospiraceae bacterium]
MVPVCVVVILAVGFLLYTAEYYHADSTALTALEPDPESDDAVTVTKTEYGWYFDGPSERDALVFYPGAKVEETAYAPLLHLLAAEGMDVCLVKMPFHLAFFGANKAGDVMAEYDYEHWYVGGHSLGGAMAANYAAEHAEELTGLVLLAAYPTKQLDESLSVVSIYGSEDGVLNMDNLAKGDAYLPKTSLKCVIEGGNHAQFGNYGAQDGDGEASISAEEQQRKTVEMILSQR